MTRDRKKLFKQMVCAPVRKYELTAEDTKNTEDLGSKNSVLFVSSAVGKVARTELVCSERLKRE